MASGYKWKPLQRATALPPSEQLVAAWMKHLKLDREAALAHMRIEHEKTELWRNDLYQIEVRRYPDTQHCHLNIRRIDGYPGRDWRHFQQIKNELVGPECEAVELYPAQSRLVDTSNKFHLWCSTDPTFRFPFGFEVRQVNGDDGYTEGGLRQRPPLQMKGGAP